MIISNNSSLPEHYSILNWIFIQLIFDKYLQKKIYPYLFDFILNDLFFRSQINTVIHPSKMNPVWLNRGWWAPWIYLVIQ